MTNKDTNNNTDINNCVDDKWIESHCWDMGKYPIKFNKNFGKDIQIPNHPEYFIHIKDNPIVKIELTSYRGTDPGAVHYYAKIIADSPSVCSMENNKIVVHRGCICDEFKKMPEEVRDMLSSSINIFVQRLVTQYDINKDPQRWNGYEVGWQTEAFYTKKSALVTAMKIVKYRFGNDWKVVVNEYC